MEYLIKGIAVMLSTIYLIYILNKFRRKKINLLDYCYIAYYLVQVIPIIIETLFGIDNTLYKYGVIYKAMLDEETDLYYSLFIIECTILFFIFSMTIKNKKTDSFLNGILKSKILNNRYTKLFAFLGMFATIPGLILAPNIKVYTEFLYLYRNNVVENSPILIFHFNVMKNLNLIAFCSILLYYTINKKGINNFWIIIATILMTWINQKRTLLLFLFIGILLIDILIKNEKNMKHILKKSISFILIEVVYFYIYRNISGKGIESSFLENYTFYFSRMANTKLAIYDMLNGKKMLAFPGETLLYELLWFVPREWWINKPYPYYVYHTAYSFNAKRAYLGWGFQTNIWCEFISNVGIFSGPLLSIFFITAIAKASTKSNSIWVYFFRRNIFDII